MFMIDAMTLVWTSLYYEYIGKYSEYMIIIGILFAGVALIGMIFIPESPKQLMEMKKYDEARKALAFIAKINGKPPFRGKFKKEIDEENH